MDSLLLLLKPTDHLQSVLIMAIKIRCTFMTFKMSSLKMASCDDGDGDDVDVDDNDVFAWMLFAIIIFIHSTSRIHSVSFHSILSYSISLLLVCCLPKIIAFGINFILGEVVSFVRPSVRPSHCWL